MASALFSLLSESGKIRRNKKGNYKLVLNGVDTEQQWFTDRPDRIQGTIATSELVEEWPSHFADSSPNSISSYINSEGKSQQVIFEQLQPKLSKKGTKMVSRINPLYNEGQDNVTGLKLKRGEFIKMKEPSIVIDDFTLFQPSKITFVNNTANNLKLMYTEGDIAPGASWMQADLDAGTSYLVTGSHDGDWDISVDVQVYSVEDMKWLTGITVQADDPWDTSPEFEYNQNGTPMHFDDALAIPDSAWGIPPKTSFELTNGYAEGDRTAIGMNSWTLTINPG